jgi:hypothetical protein
MSLANISSEYNTPLLSQYIYVLPPSNNGDAESLQVIDYIMIVVAFLAICFGIYYFVKKFFGKVCFCLRSIIFSTHDTFPAFRNKEEEYLLKENVLPQKPLKQLQLVVPMMKIMKIVLISSNLSSSVSLCVVISSLSSFPSGKSGQSSSALSRTRKYTTNVLPKIMSLNSPRYVMTK